MRSQKQKAKAKDFEDEQDEAAGSSSGSSESEVGGGADNAIGDEDEFDDIADVFESSYNFRFEEPYAPFLAFGTRGLIFRHLTSQGRY